MMVLIRPLTGVAVSLSLSLWILVRRQMARRDFANGDYRTTAGCGATRISLITTGLLRDPVVPHQGLSRYV